MTTIDLTNRESYLREADHTALMLLNNTPGGNGGVGPSADEAEEENYAIPPIPPPLPARTHPIPEDSALADYRDMMRGISEAPDSWLIAPILAVLARLLNMGVSLDFGGRKPLTLFQFIAGPAGMRKSTTIAPAEKIAARLLSPDAFVSGSASDSALFDTFEKQPHRLQIEDEGNTIIRNWGNSHCGREVSARYLKLYDGQSWGQNYRREAEAHEDGKAERRIEQATLSLVIGSTFGVSRFDGVDAASGLRRRFGYYVEFRSARVIDWPESFDDKQAEKIAAIFRPLLGVEGVIGRHSFTVDGWEAWKEIQKENREHCSRVWGITAADEAAQAALNEAPMRILKLAVIFQCCRWLKNPDLNPLELNAEVLKLAYQHQRDCLDAAAELDTVGRRANIADCAEAILATIRADFASSFQDGWVMMDKTALTNKFARHSERQNALTPSRLYREIIPWLIAQGQAKELTREGKRRVYAFKATD